jgi:2-dehydropantoate 2-reductase
MKVLVLGAGALGGYFGGWLAEAGVDVTFLVRAARKAQLDQDGLIIESPVGALSRRVTSVLADAVTPDADVILFTCKAYDLDSAIEAIRPAMGANTAVLPILNGMSHIDKLIGTFGAHRVIGGLCKIQATTHSDGRILHMNAWNEIIFGELAIGPATGLAGESHGGLSQRVTDIAACFPKPQVSAKAVPDIRTEMWKKLVHLGTVATVTTLTRQSLSDVRRAKDGPWLIETALRACAAVSNAEGIPISDSYVRDYLKIFLAADGNYKASMLRDMEKGGVTEGEHILGYLRDKAAAHGIDAPVFRIAAANVQTYELMREPAS